MEAFEKRQVEDRFELWAINYRAAAQRPFFWPCGTETVGAEQAVG